MNMFDITELIRVQLFGEKDEPGIPALDGPWKQNELVGDCAMVDRDLDHPDDVIVDEIGKPWVSDGNRIYRIGGSWFSPVKSVVHTVDGRAGAMCQHLSGALIVAISGKGVLIIGPDGSRTVVLDSDTGPMKCVTALAMMPDGDVLITDGSRDVTPERWVEDVMRSGRTGRLLRLNWTSGKVTTVAESLAWPFGVCAIDKTTALVSESWRHRMVSFELPATGRSSARSVLDNLPGYPSRIVPIQGGGYWLALFALRTPLIEFVLSEKDFLREMLDTVQPRYWVAPAIVTRDDHREPLQLGSIKQVGMKKPFSPAYSYGLVARLNERLRPIKSMHSRADGKRHGITGLASPNANSLYILSAGNGKLVHAGYEVLSK